MSWLKKNCVRRAFKMLLKMMRDIVLKNDAIPRFHDSTTQTTVEANIRVSFFIQSLLRVSGVKSPKHSVFERRNDEYNMFMNSRQCFY